MSESFNTSRPRPGLALVLCSLAAIFLCAVLCALCTAILLHPGGYLRLGGLLLLPGLLGLGLTQYAGTFQAKASRAEMVARLYAFAAGFMLIAIVCLLFDVARSGEHPSWPVAAVGAIFAGFAGWGRVGSRLNRDWAAELRRFEEEDEDEGKPQSAAGRGHPAVWGATIAVFVLAAAGFYMILGPRSGQNAVPEATPLVLPAGASDVGYWIYASDVVFEFSISERGFLKWAETQIEQRQADFEGLKAVEEKRTIPTYRTWLAGVSAPEAVIEEGYYHAWDQSGQRIQYAYDRESRRAYYASTSETPSRQFAEP